ncbi:hypothetical protein ES703_79580 [subsurface metagenome]
MVLLNRISVISCSSYLCNVSCVTQVCAGLTYAVDQTGGGLEHAHTFTSSLHFHSIPAGTDIADGSGHRNQSSNDAASGTTNMGSHVPPYHALAWIMKL